MRVIAFASTSTYKLIIILHRKFNDVPYFGYYKLLKPGIVVRDAELVKNVMNKDLTSFQDNDHKLSKKNDPLLAQNPFFFERRRMANRTKECHAIVVTGQGLSVHRIIPRKRFTHGFYFQQIKALFPSMQGTCDKLIYYLKTLSPLEDMEASDVRTPQIQIFIRW